MSSKEASKEANGALPAWALPVTVIVCLAVVVWLGWRVVTGGQEYAGPPIAVHAGQYDLRAEIAKMRTQGK